MDIVTGQSTPPGLGEGWWWSIYVDAEDWYAEFLVEDTEEHVVELDSFDDKTWQKSSGKILKLMVPLPGPWTKPFLHV